MLFLDAQSLNDKLLYLKIFFVSRLFSIIALLESDTDSIQLMATSFQRPISNNKYFCLSEVPSALVREVIYSLKKYQFT